MVSEPTLLEAYRAKKRKYDRQIDKEWAAFDGMSWDTMTDEQKENACLIAERQGKIQKSMFDAYERQIRGK